MARTYILEGNGGRHYIGSTTDLQKRIQDHRGGNTYTTRRLGKELKLVASKEFSTLEQARFVERQLKAKKNPRIAIYLLSSV